MRDERAVRGAGPSCIFIQVGADRHVLPRGATSCLSRGSSRLSVTDRSPSPVARMTPEWMLSAQASACCERCRGGFSPVRLDRGFPGRSRTVIRSGCVGAGFGESEPLVAEVGEDL